MSLFLHFRDNFLWLLAGVINGIVSPGCLVAVACEVGKLLPEGWILILTPVIWYGWPPHHPRVYDSRDDPSFEGQFLQYCCHIRYVHFSTALIACTNGAEQYWTRFKLAIGDHGPCIHHVRLHGPVLYTVKNNCTTKTHGLVLIFTTVPSWLVSLSFHSPTVNSWNSS